MHSSTSSSSAITHVCSPPRLTGWRRILASTIAVTAIGTGCIEYYARSNDNPVMFFPSPDLWNTPWCQFGESAGGQTVITVSARCKFGRVIDMWEQEPCVWPIMCAWPGSALHREIYSIAAREDNNIISDYSPEPLSDTSHSYV